MYKKMKVNVVVSEKALNITVALAHLSAFIACQQDHRLGCTSTEWQLCCIADCLHDIYVRARLQVELVQCQSHLHQQQHYTDDAR